MMLCVLNKASAKTTLKILQICINPCSWDQNWCTRSYFEIFLKPTQFWLKLSIFVKRLNGNNLLWAPSEEALSQNLNYHVTIYIFES